MTRREKYKAKVAAHGCCVCGGPAAIHHVRRLATSKKRERAPIIPLCYAHHNAGIYGVSIHAGRETWEHYHGSELAMAQEIINLFGVMP